jgi:hypothetical protein
MTDANSGGDPAYVATGSTGYQDVADILDLLAEIEPGLGSSTKVSVPGVPLPADLTEMELGAGFGTGA